MPTDFTHKLILEDERGQQRRPVIHYIGFESWTVIYLDGKLVHAWKYEDWPTLLERMGFEVRHEYPEELVRLWEPPRTVDVDLSATEVAKLVSEPSEEDDEPDLWPHSALLGGESE